MKSLSLLIALLLGGLFAAASEPDAKIEQRPLPSGPLLVRAPALSAWTVTYSYPMPKKTDNADAATATAPVRLLTLIVRKSTKLYFERKTFTDGATRESWRLGDTQINLVPDSHKLDIFEPSSFGRTASGDLLADPSVYTDYSRTDFQGLEWVSAQAYVGVAQRQGRDCLVFAQEALASSATEARPTFAYIDLQTRLPVAQEGPSAVIRYSFDPSPTMPVLPPDIQRFLEKRANAIKTMTTATPSF